MTPSLSHILNCADASSIPSDGPCEAQQSSVDVCIHSTMAKKSDPVFYLIETYTRAQKEGEPARPPPPPRQTATAPFGRNVHGMHDRVGFAIMFLM